MAKGIDVNEVLQSLPAEQRTDFAQLVKNKSGVDVTLTVAPKGRKRKHRWHNVKGHVVAVRIPDELYDIVMRRARGSHKPVSHWVKALIEREVLRSHHAKKEED